MNKQDSRTVLITISTLLGLFSAYCLFLYIKSAITFQGIAIGSYMIQDIEQNSLNWNIDKLAFETVCLLKGGAAEKAPKVTDGQISCRSKT